MILHEDGVEVSIRQQLTTRQGIYKGKNFKSGLWLKTSMGKALILSLLSETSNWVEISQKTMDQLDEIQNQYVRVKMKTPPTCSKVMLRAENSTIGMKHRIWKEKLIYLMHLKRL